MREKNYGYREVPADYRVDALALEATRRSRELGRPYSYGQLIADTTEEQRDEIAERYREELKRAIRRGNYRVSGGTKSAFMETRKEAVASVRRGLVDEDGDE